jgi:hypothetical protein
MNGDNGPSPGTTALALGWMIAYLVIVLSFALSLIVRARYLRSVVRHQSQGRTASSPATGTQPPPTLRVIITDLAQAGHAEIARPVLGYRQKALGAHLLVHAVYWLGLLLLLVLGPLLVIGVPHAIRTGDLEPLRVGLRLMMLIFNPALTNSPVWMTVLFMLLTFAAPPAFSFGVQTAVARPTLYLPPIVIGVVFVVATILTLNPASPNKYPVASAAAFATIAFAVALLQQPRLRGAAASLIMALSGSLLILWGAVCAVLGSGGHSDDSDASNGWLVGALVALLLLVAATSGAIMLGLARQYRHKRYSDRELSGWAYWTIVSLVAIGFSAAADSKRTLSSTVWMLVCIAVWVAVTVLVSRVRGRRRNRSAPASAGGLLILRVFKRPARSETFVERLLSFWRFAGPVWLIGGPDLAGANMEPDEFFEFLRGKLAKRFITAPDEVRAALEALDMQRDPDGRFRVSELFCAEPAWRATVTKLMARATVVLLDLREYQSGRAGTRFEIRQLMSTVPSERVVVLLGPGDDDATLLAELREAWETMADDSPNRRAPHTELEVCRLTSQSGREVAGLFSRLYRCARATPAGA